MTCGEAYRLIMDAWNRGESRQSIADRMGTDAKYITSVVGWYKQRGDSMFASTRPFKGKVYMPDEDDIRRNYQEHECEDREVMRQMIAVRNSLRVGDRIKLRLKEGQGFTEHVELREMEITYIGRDYVTGRTDIGIPITASIFDLWRGELEILT